MKAVVLDEYGGPEKLIYRESPVPACGDGEVLVKVKATSVNPIDYKLRSGAAKSFRPLEFPAILGRDLSGEVMKVGRGVTGFEKGMRVMALANATYAEYTVAKADILALIPDALTFEQAAALPLVLTTGAQLIELAVKPAAGQAVLVTGALGGVGRAAVHVAREHGARVVACVRASERNDAAKLEVDAVVAIDKDDEIEKLRGLDAIADTIGGEIIERLLKAIREGGVLGSVLGQPPGAKKYNIRVEAIVAKPDASRLYQLAGEAANGQFSIPVGRVLKLEQAAEAHRLVEAHQVKGKIILVP
ncbi:MAG TPA: NADP-dependent oxidoreductase [Bryobacteraceae bacterium]|nr:NADP-dependent oxidoreductase [Bryobacteraceae bacterium]